MKHLLHLITVALLLTACHTSEENYNAAYAKAN